MGTNMRIMCCVHVVGTTDRMYMWGETRRGWWKSGENRYARRTVCTSRKFNFPMFVNHYVCACARMHAQFLGNKSWQQRVTVVGAPATRKFVMQSTSAHTRASRRAAPMTPTTRAATSAQRVPGISSSNRYVTSYRCLSRVCVCVCVLVCVNRDSSLL